MQRPARRTRGSQRPSRHVRPRFLQLEPRLVLTSSATPAGFTASIELPPELGRHVPAVIWVDYSNTGATAINSPIVTLTGTQNALMSLYPQAPGQKVNYNSPGPQYSSTVQFLATGSTPGSPTILQPGESERVAIYWVGELRPWNFSVHNVKFELLTSDQTDTTPLNLSTFQADFQAEGYSAANAQQYAAATKQLLGNTLGGLAAYADADGTTPQSLDGLIASAEVAATYEVFDTGATSAASPAVTTFASPATSPTVTTFVSPAVDLPPGSLIQNIGTFPPPKGATPDQYIFLVKGYEDGSADTTDAQAIVNYNASQGRNVEVFTVDWSNASGVNGSKTDRGNYDQAAQNALGVGDEIAQYMVANGINPEQTTIAGHSLGAQAAGEAGQEIQNLTGEKLDRILAADAAGPDFENQPTNQRLDPTDASQVVAIHTTQSLGDSNQIGTTDQYVRDASVNPVTAHSQAWDLLMQSMTNPNMKTNDGQGFGNNATTPGVEQVGTQGPIHFLESKASNAALRTALHASATKSSHLHPTATGVAGSQDPNDITGPTGKVVVGSPLGYQINFENAPNATAPAQEVVINEHLDSHLNLSTFQFTDIRFGSTVIPVASGAQSVNTTVQITENGKPLNVQISASLDAQQHSLRVEFESLDPSTGLPPDVLTGFLPPEDGTGRGLADVAYSVQLNPMVHAGVKLHSAASVSFDGAPAHRTNTVTETVA